MVRNWFLEGGIGFRKSHFQGSGGRPGVHLPGCLGSITVGRMEALGKMLQMAGLVIPPLSIIAELQHSISLGQMLTFLVAAASAFWIGSILRGYSRG